MKKTLLVILITSVIMICGMGTFLWKMNSMSKKLSKQQAALLKEESDTDLSTKAYRNIKELELQTLYLEGSKKNVVTRDYNDLEEIYSPKHSAASKEALADIKRKGAYSTHDPLWAYNPYGTNPESLYLYFHSSGKCYCRYTISVEDAKVPDFTRTLDNGSADGVTKEHEYQITGFVPGMTNYLILNLYNRNNELAMTLYYKIDMPESYSGADTFLDTQKGYSKLSLTNGLYCVFQECPGKKVISEHKVKKKLKKGKRMITKVINQKKVTTVPRDAILLYDNSGVLRGEFPTGIRGFHMDKVYDNLIYACDQDSLAEVNHFGQVVKRLDMPGYAQYGEFDYDGAGSVYVLARPVSKRASYGTVVKLEVNSGEMSEALNLSDIDLLRSLMKHSTVSKPSEKSENALGINSVQVVATNQLVLGSSKYSAIFKVKNVGSLMPKLEYVIADQHLWKLKGKSKAVRRLKKKILSKALPEGEEAPTPKPELVDSILEKKKPEMPELFPSQFGQNNLIVDTTSSGLGEGQFYLEMLNNNAGAGAASDSDSSYYYRYLVDETAKNYLLKKKDSLPHNTTGGNVIPQGQSYLYCLVAKNTFEEYDKKGKLVVAYFTKQPLYRVYKSDWKGFWFR